MKMESIFKGGIRCVARRSDGGKRSVRPLMIPCYLFNIYFCLKTEYFIWILL